MDEKEQNNPDVIIALARVILLIKDIIKLIPELILTTCPNRKVVHLAKHGKSMRVRKKNIRRAIDIIQKEMEKKDA